MRTFITVIFFFLCLSAFSQQESYKIAYDRGKSEFSQGNYDAAEKQFKASLRFPDCPQPNDVGEWLKRCQSAQAGMQQGENLYNSGKYEQAQAAYQRVLNINRNDMKAKQRLADCKRKTNPVVSNEPEAQYRGYSHIWNFSEGLAPVERNEKFGFIDKTGKEVVPCIYDSVRHFNEGLALIRKDGKRGYIDKMGAQVIPLSFNYDSVSTFSQGLASVKRNGKWGFIDENGSVVIRCVYDNPGMFSEGLTPVTKNGKRGYMDRFEREAIPCIYDHVGAFCEGIAAVQKGGKYGFIDKTGKEIIACIYDGIMIAQRNVVSPNYFSTEGLAVVEKDGKWGYIDMSGTTIIPFVYEVAHPFSCGMALTKKSGDSSYFYIDKTGAKVLIYDNHDCVSDFTENRAPVCRNGLYGFIDTTGKEVIPCIYNKVDFFSEGLAVVKKGNIWKIIDTSGKVIAAFK